MEIRKPVRVERNYVQRLYATPSEVFPLLCPVRQSEWVPGWEPIVVFTESGHAEEGCIYITGEDDGESVWVITAYEPELPALELVRFSPASTVARINISLHPGDDEVGCYANIRYIYTAIGPKGEKFVSDYSEAYFRRFMQFWESALNDYMQAGRELNERMQEGYVDGEK